MDQLQRDLLKQQQQQQQQTLTNVILAMKAKRIFYIFLFSLCLGAFGSFYMYLLFCKKRFLYRNDNSIMNNIQLAVFNLNEVNVINGRASSDLSDVKIKCYFNTEGKKDSVTIFDDGERKNFRIPTGKGGVAFSVFRSDKEILIFRQYIPQNFYTHIYEFRFSGTKEQIEVDYNISGPISKFNVLVLDSFLIKRVNESYW